jgi:hypothetical protein
MSTLLRDIGTIEWSRRTRGIMNASERARYMAAVMLQIGRVAPGLLALKAGLRGSGPDPSAYAVPDTAFTRSVVDACRQLDPMLIEHGYRSYLYARALGDVDHIECDPEALFAAAILHDYAFHDMAAVKDCCFTFAGTEIAAEFLSKTKLEASLQHAVLDAITLHANPTVPLARGGLQFLLHAGVMVDVLGLRAFDLDWDGVERVATKHPRHAFTARGEPILRGHADRVAGTRARAGFQCGFSLALRLGPWVAYETAHPNEAGSAPSRSLDLPAKPEAERLHRQV